MRRNLQRWTQNYEMAKTDEIPEMQRLMEFLQKNLNENDSDIGIVHGDFRWAACTTLSQLKNWKWDKEKRKEDEDDQVRFLLLTSSSHNLTCLKL